MPKLRVGVDTSLYCKPLTYGLEDSADLVWDAPAKLVAGLETGKLDVALIPTSELFRHPGWRMIPAGAITSRGQSETFMLRHRSPLNKLGKVALDGRAKGHDGPVRVVLQLMAGAQPRYGYLEFVNGKWPEFAGPSAAATKPADAEAPPPKADFSNSGDETSEFNVGGTAKSDEETGEIEMPSVNDDETGDVELVDELEAEGASIPAGPADAQFLVGDDAFRAACAAVDDKELAAELVDVGTEWHEWTGLPFVHAVWAARSNVDVTELGDALLQARNNGLENLEKIAAAEAERFGVPVDRLLDHLTRCVGYAIGPAEQRGLLGFADKAAEIGLIESSVPNRVVHLENPARDPTKLLEDARGRVEAESARAAERKEGTNLLRSVQKASEPPVDYLAKAKDAFNQRQYRQALKMLEAGIEAYGRTRPSISQRSPHSDTRAILLKAFSDEPHALLLRGRLNYHLLRFREARADLFRAADFKATTKMARYTLARMAMEESRYERAARILRRMLEDFPADVSYQAHCNALLATCAMFLGRPTSAQAHRDAAEAHGLTSSELLVEHGRALQHDAMWDEAAAYYGEAVNADPTNAVAYFQLANLFYIHGQYTKAEEILAYGIEHAPEEIYFFTLLGDLRRAQRKFDDAVTLYRLALEISSKGTLADYLIHQVAQCLYLQDKLGEGRNHFLVLSKHFRRSVLRQEAEHFAEALAKPPQDGKRVVIENFPAGVQLPDFCGPKVISALLTHFGQPVDQSEVAQEIFDDGVEFPAMRRYLQKEGFKTYVMAGDRDVMQRVLNSQVPAIVAEYKGLDGHFLAAIGFDTNKDAVIVQDPAFQDPVDIPWREFEKAWDVTSKCMLIAVPSDWPALGEALELEDTAWLVKWLEATELRAQGKLDKAIDVATTAARDAAADTDTAGTGTPAAQALQKLLVELELEKGDIEAAAARCNGALAERKQCFWAAKYLGDTLFGTEDYVGAIKQYQKAKAICRDESTLWGMQGFAYYRVGNLARARQCLRRSLELESARADVEIALGDVLWELAKPREASYRWCIALELDPDSEEPKRRLREHSSEIDRAGGPRDVATTRILMSPELKARILQAAGEAEAGLDDAVKDEDLEVVDELPEDNDEAADAETAADAKPTTVESAATTANATGSEDKADTPQHKNFAPALEDFSKAGADDSNVLVESTPADAPATDEEAEATTEAEADHDDDGDGASEADGDDDDGDQDDDGSNRVDPGESVFTGDPLEKPAEDNVSKAGAIATSDDDVEMISLDTPGVPLPPVEYRVEEDPNLWNDSEQFPSFDPGKDGNGDPTAPAPTSGSAGGTTDKPGEKGKGTTPFGAPPPPPEKA